ncbi:MAG: hypothetical protein ABSE68_02730 [Minisyncoccia bacterium]
MTFEQIPKPFIRNKVEKEKKEGRFEQPVDVVASRFFDGFIEKNSGVIESGALGIVGNDLEVGISRLVGAAENEKGKEYADELAKHLLAGLDVYRPIVADRVKDPEVKVAAREHLLNYVAPDNARTGFEHEKTDES